MNKVNKKLPAVVWALGLASFLTDLSSEMIYPLLPVFLVGTLGAGAVSLGIIEGVAETTASVLKVFSGRWADPRSVVMCWHFQRAHHGRLLED